MRRLARGLAIALGLTLLVAVAAYVVLPRMELAGFAAARASAALGRPVAIDSLRIVPGRQVRITLRGARLANIEGGSQAAMATLQTLDASLDAFAVLRGRLVFTQLHAGGAALLLERTADRRANWRFGAPSSAAPSLAMPVLHDLNLSNSEIVVRTSSGQALRIRVDAGRLGAPDTATPITLAVRGRYNEVPLAVDGTLGSFAALADAAAPFPFALRALSGDTTLDLNGTATDPLNADGLRGRATLRAPTLDVLFAIAGAGDAPSVPLELTAIARRDGDSWRLSDAEGTLDGAAFTGRLLQLTEGAAGRPDSVTAELAFSRLDADRLLGTGAGETDMALEIAAHPDPLLRLRLAADRLRLARQDATDVALAAELAPRRVTVENLALVALGAQWTGQGVLSRADSGTDLQATLRMLDGDLDGLRRALGVGAVPLRGPVEARAVVASRGAMLNQAARDARITAVLAMSGGTVAREVIEMASTDLRALFRTARGFTPLTCLLAVIEIEAGRGEAAPLRMRAGTGTVSGLATFDLRRRQLDLLIGSARETTNFWALDIPVRVSGGFADPDIALGEWPPQAAARLAEGDNLARLSPVLRDFATGNACYQAGRRR